MESKEYSKVFKVIEILNEAHRNLKCRSSSQHNTIGNGDYIMESIPAASYSETRIYSRSPKRPDRLWGTLRLLLNGLFFI
jgi:hypothetical protein